LAAVIFTLSFAVYQAYKNERLTLTATNLQQEQEQTQAALNQTIKHAALFALERGLFQCKQEEVQHGLLWLARALETTSQLPPADATDLEYYLRANLAHWACESFLLRFVLPQAGPWGHRAITVAIT
jgi:hypothetical protein